MVKSGFKSRVGYNGAWRVYSKGKRSRKNAKITSFNFQIHRRLRILAARGKHICKSNIFASLKTDPKSLMSKHILCILDTKRSQKNTKITAFPDPPVNFYHVNEHKQKNLSVQLSGPTAKLLTDPFQNSKTTRCKKPQAWNERLHTVGSFHFSFQP